MRRRLVMLLSDYNPKKFSIGGSWLSEKYDGFRALWLPHTRGIRFTLIPFANTARDKRDPICSGLWTRRGKNIAAPDWWLNQLPEIPLDGELYLGRGNFQKVASASRKLEAVDDEWRSMTYMVFDSPSLEQFYRAGEVSEGGKVANPSYKAKFAWDAHLTYKSSPNYKPRRFNEVLTFLEKHAFSNVSMVAPQKQLPFSDIEAQAYIDQTFEEVINDGGEGLVLRRGHSIWEPIRSLDVVKLKPVKSSEAQIVGYVMGKGKHEGRIGALRLSWNQGSEGRPTISFDLGGLTDEERTFTRNAIIVKAEDAKPGGIVTTTNMSDQFKLGSMVKFVYNDLTEDGIPKFARYSRTVEDDEDEVPTDDPVRSGGVSV